jgi:hypothetical protein
MPNGWEWAILVLIAVLLVGGARLSGISRDVRGPESEDAPLESTEPKSPSSPASAAPSPSPSVEPSDEPSVPSAEAD